MRVLTVTSEHKISAYVRRGLEAQGHTVCAAYTGPEALACAETMVFDLVILDLDLDFSDTHGVAVARELRTPAPHSLIIGLAAREALANQLETGLDDYLVKPFALRALMELWRGLTPRASVTPAVTFLQVADLTLETDRQRVRRGARSIVLTSKEFAVLECLLREPGRVFTRPMIARYVWNYSVCNPSNVVDVYIRRLRRKVDDGFDVKLIRTMRGVGYLLVGDTRAAAA